MFDQFSVNHYALLINNVIRSTYEKYIPPAFNQLEKTTYFEIKQLTTK